MADESKPDQDKQEEGKPESKTEPIGESVIVDPPQPPQPPPLPQPKVVQEPDFPWAAVRDQQQQHRRVLRRQDAHLPPDPEMVKRAQERELELAKLRERLSATKEEFRAVAEQLADQQRGTNLQLADTKEQLNTARNKHLELVQKIEEVIKEREIDDQLADLEQGVNDTAQKLLRSQAGGKLVGFFRGGAWTAFVMSVDIRKSTSLMLKAPPIAFGEFLKELHGGLANVVVNNYGYLDKFTGDGILAFFPYFFTGEDFGYWAIKSAAECHDVFEAVYRKHRSSFKSVMRDAGLGIGIDCGDVQPVVMSGHLTGVGEAVVFACRFGGAPVGKTFLNQRAFDECKKYGTCLDFVETEIEVKHEGWFLAYDVTIKSPYDAKLPSWYNQIGVIENIKLDEGVKVDIPDPNKK